MARSTCTQCGEVFAGLTGFDAHQTQYGERVTCKAPADFGLALNDRGEWAGSPRKNVQAETVKVNNNVGTRAQAGRKAHKPKTRKPKTRKPKAHKPKDQGSWIRECRSCNSRFTKPEGRGRPPVTCTACGGKGILV